MPTKHQRIPVTNDEELAEALASVRSLFAGVPAARVVHDLAVRGAASLAAEERARDEAIGRLKELSANLERFVDLDVLERIDELAWGSG